MALHESLQRVLGLVLVFVETKRNAEYLLVFLFRTGTAVLQSMNIALNLTSKSLNQAKDRY